MALARIITRLSSGYYAIERDLRARGFRVETRRPDEVNLEPADLEITIEECAPEHALTRAMDGGGDASVFVAPEALTGGRPVAAIPFVPSLQPAISAIPPEIGHTVVVESPATTESAAELQSEEMIAPPPVWHTETAIGDLAQNVETHEDVLAMENQESVQPEIISSQTQINDAFLLAANQDTREQGIEANPAIQVHSAIATQAQPEIPKESVVSAMESSVPPELSEPDHESLAAQAVEQFTDFESPAGIEPQTDETPLDQDGETEPVQEPILAASDATVISEVEPVIPALTQQAEAAAVPVELHSDRAAVDAGAQTAPSDWPIWQPLADPAPVQVVQSVMSEAEVPPQVVMQAAPPNTAPASLPRRTPNPNWLNLQAYRAALKRFSTDDTLFWKTATLAATVAVTAMLVAVSFHRFSPIPATLENPVLESSGEPQAPAAVVKSRQPASAAPADVKTVAAESVVQAKPSVLMEASRVPNVSAAQKVGLAASKQKMETNPQSGSDGNDVIAEDTVVRYGASPVSPTSPAAQKKAQVKRYSDKN